MFDVIYGVVHICSMLCDVLKAYSMDARPTKFEIEIAAVMMYMGSSRGNWNILDSRIEFSRFSEVCKL